jgi:TNF receptor-associated protein 1
MEGASQFLTLAFLRCFVGCIAIGIGMTEEELVANLGTIARSGSKAFIEKLEGDASTPSGGAKDKIIGQFGVGFYSAFMVGDKIEVFTRSAMAGSPGLKWTSDGLGSYDIAPAEGVSIGTKIVIYLKDDCLEFCNKMVVQGLVKKYSNFVGFPIKLNSETINSIQPLWAMVRVAVKVVPVW